MGTSQAEIAGWLAEAQAEGQSHLIVFCDTFDWGDYPVGVSGFEEYRAALREHVINGGCKVMEVYDLSMPLETQLNEWRAHHPPVEPVAS